MRIIKTLLVITVGLSAASCIDYKYDLDKFDPKMTLLPGISVPVNSISEVQLKDILPSDSKLFQAGKNGDYRMVFRIFGDESTSIQKEIYETSSEVRLNTTLAILRNDLPKEIDDFSMKVRRPIVFEIDNPTEEALSLSADIYRGDLPAGSVSGLAVPAGKSSVRIADDSFSSLLDPFDEDIIIDNIVLSRPRAELGETDIPAVCGLNDDLTYTFSISAHVPMEFAAGEGITFRITSDFFRKIGITDAIVDFDIRVKTIDINASITNEFPVNIKMSSEFAGGQGTVIIPEIAIAAGTVRKPVTTDLTISAPGIGTIKGVSSVSLNVSAIVPESSTTSVSLKGSNKIIVYINDVTIPDGIVLFPDD